MIIFGVTLQSLAYERIDEKSFTQANFEVSKILLYQRNVQSLYRLA